MLDFNAAACQHFSRRGVELQKPDQTASDQTALRCICAVSGGPNAYLDDFCQFERAYKALGDAGKWGPDLMAFHFNRSNGYRPYELFLMHVKKPADGAMYCRLMPLPMSTFQVKISDFDQQFPPAANGHLASVPLGVHVRAGDDQVLMPLVKTRDEIRGIGQLLEAHQFASQVLEYLHAEDAKTPYDAWSRAAKHAPGIELRVPPSVREPFLPASAATKQKAERALRAAWNYSLDAPVLLDVVFPQIRAKIQTDDEFLYLPPGEEQDEEREQYLRARMPLVQLETLDLGLERSPAQQSALERVLDNLQIWNQARLLLAARAIARRHPNRLPLRFESRKPEELRHLLTGLAWCFYRDSPAELIALGSIVSEVNTATLNKG